MLHLYTSIQLRTPRCREDTLAPQLLLRRFADPSGAEALAFTALPPQGAAAQRLRPTPEETFVLVPTAWERPPAAPAPLFSAAASVLFLQPSTWRCVQVDLLSRRRREVQLPKLSGAVAVSATATSTMGVELFVALPTPRSGLGKLVTLGFRMISTVFDGSYGVLCCFMRFRCFFNTPHTSKSSKIQGLSCISPHF